MDDFVSTSYLLQAIGVGKSTLYQLRVNHKLLLGIHFIRIPNGKKILWNLRLVKDYFITGGDNSHQQAIEAYLHTLPSNQSKAKNLRRKKGA